MCRKPRHTVAANYENRDFWRFNIYKSIRFTGNVEMIKKCREMIFIVLPIF